MLTAIQAVPIWQFYVFLPLAFAIGYAFVAMFDNSPVG